MLAVDTPTAQVIEAISTTGSALQSCSVEAAFEPELRALLGSIRGLQTLLDDAVVRIGLRADALATEGRSAPAGEVLLGRGEVTGRQARTEAARVELAHRLPGVVGSGLSGERLDALAHHTTRLDDDQLGGLDIDRLVADATRVPVDTFNVGVKRAVDAVIGDGGLAEAEAKRAASEFRHYFDLRRGMGRFWGRLDPERYEAMVTAVDHHTRTLANETDQPVVKDANLAAAALVDLVTDTGPRHTHRPHITVIVDAETLQNGFHGRSVAQTSHGRDLTQAAVARLCCDAVLRRVIHDRRGLPVDVGRAYRTATDAQWVALRSLYSTCGWEHCRRPIDHCQAHHIRLWEQWGPTDLDNLVPLCSTHHHRVHEGGWHLRLEPDRRLVITRPDGTHHTTTHPPTRRPTNDTDPAQPP